MTTIITLLHPDSRHLQLNEKKIEEFCHNLLQSVDKAEFSLSLVLVDDIQIKELNHRYRQKDKATNVLSFPFLDGAEAALSNLPLYELGDIIISLDTAEQEAKEYNVDFSHRFCWLIVHGLLHLCGMDHERSPKEAEEMANKEQELLKKWQQELCGK